jgi:uncharacterized protein YeaO (DUF488 family)
MELKVLQWMRATAPSASLRKSCGHRPKKWEDFRKRYREELRKPPRRPLLDDLLARARKEGVTLVFAARHAKRSNAAVVAELIREGVQSGRR